MSVELIPGRKYLVGPNPTMRGDSVVFPCTALRAGNVGELETINGAVLVDSTGDVLLNTVGASSWVDPRHLILLPEGFEGTTALVRLARVRRDESVASGASPQTAAWFALERAADDVDGTFRPATDAELAAVTRALIGDLQ
jgi:hypothetical protein